MGSVGSFDATTLRNSGETITTASPGDQAQRIKEQATALHRAGEYDEAAREFARAAKLLEEAGGALAPPPALSAIRLSLAAAQLKVCRPLCSTSNRLTCRTRNKKLRALCLRTKGKGWVSV